MTNKEKVQEFESFPSAWRVTCPKGHEFDAKIYAEEADAEDDALGFAEQHINSLGYDPDEEEVKEIESIYKPVPLYAKVVSP